MQHSILYYKPFRFKLLASARLCPSTPRARRSTRSEPMPPRSKRAAPDAAASATPAPIGPQTASPIHSACARRADAHGGLPQKAVYEVLDEVGLPTIAGHYAHAKKHLASVAEACGVPYLGDPFGRGSRGDKPQAFRVEHVLYLAWEHVVKAMDDAGAQNSRAEETPVASSAQSLVLAAVAAENLAFGDADPRDCGDVAHGARRRA